MQRQLYRTEVGYLALKIKCQVNALVSVLSSKTVFSRQNVKRLALGIKTIFKKYPLPSANVKTLLMDASYRRWFQISDCHILKFQLKHCTRMIQSLLKIKKERISPAVCMNYGNIPFLSFLSLFLNDATGKSVQKATGKNKGIYLSVSVNWNTLARDPYS